MSFEENLREQFADDRHESRTDSHLLFECRHCGNKSSRPTIWCRMCGSIEIARYTFRSGD